MVEDALPSLGYDKKRGQHVVRWRDPPDDNGKRVERIKRFDRKDLAQRFFREVEEDLALGRPWQPRVSRRAPGLDEASRAYLTERARRLAPNTLMRHAHALTMFPRSLSTPTPTVSDVNRETLGAFHDWLLRPDTSRHGEGQRAPRTVLKVISVIEAFWRWLADHDDYMAHVPRPRKLHLASAPVVASIAPRWTEADAAIEACTDEMVRRALIICRFTGLRIAQVRALDVADLDMKSATLRVRTGKSAQEKAGRVVPVSRHIVDIVRGWGVESGPLVPDGRVRQALERHIVNAWRASGVREAVWKGRPHHAFRKCFASELARAGANAEAVEQLVGHSRGLRGVYVEAEALPMRAAVDLIPPLHTPIVVDITTRKARS